MKFPIEINIIQYLFCWMITERRIKLLMNSGLISALVSIVLFIAGTVTVMLLVEDHDFIRDVISVTGHDNPYAIYFNLTLIVSGILITPCFLIIYFIMKRDNDHKPKLLLALAIIGTLIGPFLSFAGVFNEGDYFVLHIVFAVGAYLFVIVTAFCWGIYVKTLDGDHVYKSFKIWVLDPIVNIVIIMCIIAYAIAMIFFQNFIWATLGILEKLTIYAFFFYFILIIVRFLIILNRKD